MKYLDVILRFLVSLARIIFPGKKSPTGEPASPTGESASSAATPVPPTAPFPVPDGDHPSLPADAGDPGNIDSNRSAPLPDLQDLSGKIAAHSTGKRPIPIHPTDIAGCCLMISGSLGCLYKWFLS